MAIVEQLVDQIHNKWNEGAQPKCSIQSMLLKVQRGRLKAVALLRSCLLGRSNHRGQLKKQHQAILVPRLQELQGLLRELRAGSSSTDDISKGASSDMITSNEEEEEEGQGGMEGWQDWGTTAAAATLQALRASGPWPAQLQQQPPQQQTAATVDAAQGGAGALKGQTQGAADMPAAETEGKNGDPAKEAGPLQPQDYHQFMLQMIKETERLLATHRNSSTQEAQENMRFCAALSAMVDHPLLAEPHSVEQLGLKEACRAFTHTQAMLTLRLQQVMQQHPQ